ncbi:acyl carrier protein [Photorhabdus luminescens subsp. luminescens]|uniref:Acyl carrier protein n=3 Tax=Photorhabdus luminescens TaxID=29488 RepID=A0A1G5QIW6_PHOLU|nr:phosphopantetheine-binding protein [Photorhabdus luminescens]KMW71090.1 acyl carrier protein [Photorhabdus luminescens subsp. luminescens]SCZ61536.1 acyl carrier protein [Photorhabdus luminescens]
MMNKSEIFSIIKNILTKELNVGSLNDISESTSLRDELGLDSMTTLTFLMSLEDNVPNFMIDANTLEASDVQSIGSVCDYVLERLNGVS